MEAFSKILPLGNGLQIPFNFFLACSFSKSILGNSKSNFVKNNSLSKSRRFEYPCNFFEESFFLPCEILKLIELISLRSLALRSFSFAGLIFINVENPSPLIGPKYLSFIAA